jgi:hypothetical protein
VNYYAYYGDTFTVECPTGSGRLLNLYQIAEELARRLTRIFLRDGQGRRPVFGGSRKFLEDPHWRDLLLFYEYFHGDNGAGLGASHQTGWTGMIARVMHMFATTTAKQVLELGQRATIVETSSAWGGQLATTVIVPLQLRYGHPHRGTGAWLIALGWDRKHSSELNVPPSYICST